MTADTTASTAMDASTATLAAEEAARRARQTVDELRETVTSAVRVLQDAEFDSAKYRLSDRGDYYLEIAAEHLGRLQSRCTGMRELTDELGHHLDRAAGAVAEALDRIVELGRGEVDPQVAEETGYLRQRLGVLGEMIDLSHPLATLAGDHLDGAREASRAVTSTSLLEPRSLEHSLREAGQELGRADEDLRVLETVVDRASASARQSVGVATEISETAYRRMSNHRDVPRAASSPGFGLGTPPR